MAELRRQPRQRSPLFLLDAFGWSEWNLWALGEGALSEWCPTCSGTGIVIDSPCYYRAIGECPGAETGCVRCRHRCGTCHGARLREPDAVRVDDFGDVESRRAAQAMFPGLVIEAEKRSDMAARAL